MKLRRRNFSKGSEEHNFWPSFADVMSTIALILFFMMLLVYIQNVITGNKLTAARIQLDNTEKKLAQARIEISDAEKELMLLKEDMEKTKAELERGQVELALSQKKIREQKKIIAMSNQELGNMRAKLEQIALLRLDILQKVKESIEAELGKSDESGQPLVTIGDNANIVINEKLVFDYNSYQVKPEGKELLRELAVVFERVLDDSDIKENIDAIIIEGHTDDVGSSAYNRDLSTKRATSVVNFMMASNPDLEEKYGKYFAATGYSKFRPLVEGTSKEARQKNRRIEISISIKDSNVRKVITEYLEETQEMLDDSGVSTP